MAAQPTVGEEGVERLLETADRRVERAGVAHLPAGREQASAPPGPHEPEQLRA
jgi:hypothetical protein